LKCIQQENFEMYSRNFLNNKMSLEDFDNFFGIGISSDINHEHVNCITNASDLDMNEKELQAIGNYKNGSTLLNQYIRGDVLAVPKQIQIDAVVLKNLLDYKCQPSKCPIVVWRTMSMEYIIEKPGQIIASLESGILSTTLSREYTDFFVQIISISQEQEFALLEISIPAGMRGLYLGDQEHEVLFGPGNSIVLDSITPLPRGLFKSKINCHMIKS
jgi:hypothetical protein